MNKKIKNNINKQTLFAFVLGALLFGTIGVGASTLLSSSDVTYDNSSSGLNSTNLQEALDELYEQAKNAPNCDIEGNCTVECPSGQQLILKSNTTYKCGIPPVEMGGKKVDVVTSGDGLYVDDYESGRYVYKGASPNNYITFNGSTWRILAVETDGTLKIMKQDNIGNMAYDSNSSGAWSSATLNTYLNGTYYNTLDNTFIQNHSFNVGNVSYSDSLTTTINEEKTTTWTGNIALSNVSDVIKSNTNTSICGSIRNINFNYSTCKTSSFIGTTMASIYPWLLSLDSADASRAWYVDSSHGDVSNDSVHKGLGVLPVLYLSSDITLTGSGTSTDPYQITG